MFLSGCFGPDILYLIMHGKHSQQEMLGKYNQYKYQESDIKINTETRNQT